MLTVFIEMSAFLGESCLTGIHEPCVMLSDVKDNDRIMRTVGYHPKE